MPFKENIPEGLKKLDMGAFEFIQKLDAKGLLGYRDSTGATICGCVPIAVLLETLGKDAKAELVRYTTSGEMTGDYSNSVSYLAAAWHGKWTNSAPPARIVRPSDAVARGQEAASFPGAADASVCTGPPAGAGAVGPEFHAPRNR